MYAIYGYTMPLLIRKAHVYGYSQEERLSLVIPILRSKVSNFTSTE